MKKILLISLFLFFGGYAETVQRSTPSTLEVAPGVDQSDIENLLGKMRAMKTKIEELEKKNKDLEEKVAKLKLERETRLRPNIFLPNQSKIQMKIGKELMTSESIFLNTGDPGKYMKDKAYASFIASLANRHEAETQRITNTGTVTKIGAEGEEVEAAQEFLHQFPGSKLRRDAVGRTTKKEQLQRNQGEQDQSPQRGKPRLGVIKNCSNWVVVVYTADWPGFPGKRFELQPGEVSEILIYPAGEKISTWGYFIYNGRREYFRDYIETPLEAPTQKGNTIDWEYQMKGFKWMYYYYY